MEEPQPLLGMTLDIHPMQMRRTLKKEGYLIAARGVDGPFQRIVFRSRLRDALFDEVITLECLQKRSMAGIYAVSDDKEAVRMQARKMFGTHKESPVAHVPPPHFPAHPSLQVEAYSPEHSVWAGEVRYAVFTAQQPAVSGISMDNPRLLQDCAVLQTNDAALEKALFESINQEIREGVPAGESGIQEVPGNESGGEEIPADQSEGQETLIVESDEKYAGTEPAKGNPPEQEALRE